jgi:signal peptidase II
MLAGRRPVTVKEHAAPVPTDLPRRGSARQRYLVMLPTAAVVIGLDHLSKWLVSSNLAVGQSVPATRAFVNIHYIRNSGAAFGIFPQFSGVYLVVAAIVALYVLVYGPRMGGGVLRLLALGCLLGGAISNGIDRLLNGYVVDFLDFHFWLFQIFNLADVAIVGGILVLVIEIAFSGAGSQESAR